MSNLKPVSNHLIVRAIKEEPVSESGIIIPETATKERPMKGEVIAVGPGKDKPLEVACGDKILFTKYGPIEIKIDGEELLVLEDSDVLAIII
jgi:chaperonin GroES